MTELKDRNTSELRADWLDTIALRQKVLDLAKHTGFSVNDLVSRTAEHSIEMFYGRKVLEDGTLGVGEKCNIS